MVKLSDLVNINIKLLDHYLSAPPTAHAFPNTVHLFNIYVFPKEEGNLNNTRMARYEVGT